MNTGKGYIVPFGCDKRGAEEDGYLRLCGACQAIRELPDDFFPPYINEVICDVDKACLYFYDYREFRVQTYLLLLVSLYRKPLLERVQKNKGRTKFSYKYGCSFNF